VLGALLGAAGLPWTLGAPLAAGAEEVDDAAGADCRRGDRVVARFFSFERLALG
jgi:hypothetical protein